MSSLADALPAEIARQINPGWRKNEAGYWAVRDQLLAQYQGRWVGFADGAVVAAGATPLEVFLAIQNSGTHPFVIRVGHEGEPWYRIRRTSFHYGKSYCSCWPQSIPESHSSDACTSVSALSPASPSRNS
jgi:hypothetical protein